MENLNLDLGPGKRGFGLIHRRATPSMKTERRITFQRGDFIRFDSKNDIVVGSIENIFVRDSFWSAGTVDKISGNLGTRNARAGDKFL